MTEKPRGKTPKIPNAPEKDEYGCLIGVEVWDAEKRKCVPITKPSTIGTEPFHERDWVEEADRDFKRGRQHPALRD
jgi:hypothetical protein